MIVEEKKKMEELKVIVEFQVKWIVVQKVKENMGCFKWVELVYEYYKGFIYDKRGSYDFWC